MRKVWHFQQLQGQGSHHWIQRSVALRRVRLWNFLAPSSDFFSQGEWKCSLGPMASCELWFDFFSPSELLYPNRKNRQQRNRARPTFYVSSHSPNVSFGVVDCSLYSRRNAFKDDYHKKNGYAGIYSCRVELFRTLKKNFNHCGRRNHFIQRNSFKKAPVGRIAIAIHRNSGSTASYTENPFWYQHFDLRPCRTIRGSQPIVDFVAVDKWCLYLTTQKAAIFKMISL